MEPPLSSLRPYGQPSKRNWSPPDRPTVNTSILTHSSSSATPLDQSPLIPPLSSSSTPSPWMQQISLSNGPQTPSLSYMMQNGSQTLLRSQDTQPHAPSHPSVSSNDWGNVFSSPLDPSTFAALAASGMITPNPPGLPASLPVRSFRSPAGVPMNPRLTPKDSGHMNQPSSNIDSPWPSSYSPASTLSQRNSPAQHASSNAAGGSYSKRRSPIGGTS